jgi:hypothetical protein
MYLNIFSITKAKFLGLLGLALHAPRGSASGLKLLTEHIAVIS